MFAAKIFQKSLLFFLMVFFNSAQASPIREWEGTFEETDPGNPVQRGLNEEAPVEEQDRYNREVSEKPKRRNEVNVHRKDLAMKPFQENRIRDIKDETATTGENAKKRLPPSLKPQAIAHPPFMYDIHQHQIVHPPLLKVD